MNDREDADREVRRLHRETGRGWDLVAAGKYARLLDDRERFLREGGDPLLPAEREALAPLLRACRRAVHLQCSHGLDTLGLWRAGADEVVGVDISGEMVRQARSLAERLGAPARFFKADVLDAPPVLTGTADLVYTGKGALPWILDLGAWAETVARLLAPTGHVFVFEGHPLDAAWDRRADEPRLRPGWPGYFAAEPVEQPGFPATAAARAAEADESGSEVADACRTSTRRPRMVERQWRPGQVVGALIGAGLVLEHMAEHPDSYWPQFPDWPERQRVRLPHSYSILARLPQTDRPEEPAG